MVRRLGVGMRLIDFFDKASLRHPERCAFVDRETSLTYAQMGAFSRQLSAAMRERGLSDTGRVAIYSPNSARAFGCVLATIRAGGTWVPINIRNPVPINAQFMSLTGCEWLFYHSSAAEAAQLLRRQVPTLGQLVCIDRRDADIPSVDDLIGDGGEHASIEMPHDPHRMVTILGSGGTTGQSKAVRWDNLTWETLIAQAAVNMTPLHGATAPVHLCVAPMTHAAGVIAIMLLPFAPTNVILDKTEPLEIMTAIARYKVTHLYLPPTMLYAMLAHPRVREFDYRSLTHFIVAAAPVAPDKLAEAVEVFGPCMCQYYGQVEAPMVATFLSPAQVLDATVNPAPPASAPQLRTPQHADSRDRRG